LSKHAAVNILYSIRCVDRMSVRFSDCYQGQNLNPHKMYKCTAEQTARARIGMWCRKEEDANGNVYLNLQQ